MSIENLKKEDLELLSYKDITNMLLEEKGAMNTADLFKKITSLLELPDSVYQNKIGDYYTTLTTDKRFLLLEDGNWDLRSRHTSDKVIIPNDQEDEEEEEELEIKEEQEEESNEYDDSVSDEDDFDDSDDDLKDLVIINEEDQESDLI